MTDAKDFSAPAEPYREIEYWMARAARAEAALMEIHRRTGLLMSQNTGRWKMTTEHDRRTVDVLTVNQDIAHAVLAQIEKETGRE